MKKVFRRPIRIRFQGDLCMKICYSPFFLSLLFFQTGALGAEKLYVESLLEASVQLISKSIPFQLNPTLTMYRISTENNELTYHYKSTAMDVSHLKVDKFKSARTEELTNHICNAPAQKAFRDHKVILHYEYIDKNDRTIATISIDTDKC